MCSPIEEGVLFVRLRRALGDDSGQAVVEAAFALPVMMLLAMMLVQPAIILYDRTVMQAAAAEGCRLLATAAASEGDSSSEDYVRRRLSAVPQQDLFHVHGSSCSWDIDLAGDSSSSEVSVRIGNRVKLLPLFNAGAALLGVAGPDGSFPMEVRVSMPTQPSWVSESSVGYASSGWVGAWMS